MNIELAPRVMEMEDKNIEFKGDASEQYEVWRKYLLDLYELEKNSQRYFIANQHWNIFLNIKIDRKIDVAGRKKKKKTFLLIFLASFIALVLSFFVISLPDIPASSKQTSKTNETTTYSPRLQAESPNKYENLEALSYFETKKKLQVIAGVEENRNIYSNRARELLERLESLGEGFWEDQKRGEFLIDQSRVFIEQIERKKWICGIFKSCIYHERCCCFSK